MKEFKIPPRDAWNTTLREFCLLMNHDKKAPVRDRGEQEFKDMMENFQLLELYRRHG